MDLQDKTVALKTKLKQKLEKQEQKIALLEVELKEINKALEEKNEFAKALEADLEHAILQLERLNQSNYSSLASNYAR